MKVHLWVRSTKFSDICRHLYAFLKFNVAVNCKHYIASVVDEWMCMEHWWNILTVVKQVLGRNLSQLHFFHHKFYMESTGTDHILTQRVNLWLLTAVSWFRSQDSQCELCGGEKWHWDRPFSKYSFFTLSITIRVSIKIFLELLY